MMTLTGRGTRTITGYVSKLLEHPRWVIERDVDFTDCPYDGNYDDDITVCVQCSFGTACRWLNQRRSPAIDAGTVDKMIAALQSAVYYLQAKAHHGRGCQCHNCSWLREARQFLHSQSQ